MHRIAEGPFNRMLVGVFVLVAVLAFSGCSTEENEENECDKTKKEEIEPLFRIYVRAELEGGGPYTGMIDFQSEKHYCDGTVKGVFTDHTDGTPDGFWKPITTQYKLANEKDFVLMLFTAGGEELSVTYGYERVEAEMYLEDYTTWVFADTVDVIVIE
jgi:hypothetical protein